MRTIEIALMLGVLFPLQALRAGEEPRKLGPFGAECRVVFTPDGKALAVTLRGGTAALVDLESGRRTTRYTGLEEGSESALAVSPDGSKLALGTLEGVVKVYETKGGKELLTVNHGGAVHSLAFSADGKVLVTAGGLPTKEIPAEGEEGEGGEAPDPEGPTARTWDVSTGEPGSALDAGSGNTGSGVAASPKGPIVALARADGKLELFNLGEKKRHAVEAGASATVVAFSPDGKLVAVLGGKDGAAATIVDVGAGSVLRTAGAGAPASVQGALAFSPDGKWLARGTPEVDGVQLFSVESGKLERTIGAGQVASLAFSPDGKWLAAGLRTGDVLLLDPSK